jgi:hypothetical protein
MVEVASTAEAASMVAEAFTVEVVSTVVADIAKLC